MPRLAKGAGWIRGAMSFRGPIASGTGAQEVLTDLTPGFQFVVERVYGTVKVAFAGAGATRLFRALKGASTVVASKTIALADGAAVGTVIELTLGTLAARTFSDADTLSFDSPAADSVSFSAGEIEWTVIYRQRMQQAG